ncbi:MAG: nucleoside triphosphate pyrophosphohydrolase [Kiritimatiellae bacterium]|nr:nucleoside triphosphate pyrophosphohydrolase [Kiritimatiellia bacterium]
MTKPNPQQSSIPESSDPVERLRAIVAILRSDNGCPWDREQTLDSLKPYLIEEAYELLDAVDSGDAKLHREELGDVLLQVVLHAQIRSEAGDFDFGDVAHTLSEKLIRRHPHVFGDAVADDSDAVVQRWEAIKQQERAGSADDSVLSGVPRSLPALQRAQRMQSRAARVGFDWECRDGVVAKLDEEIAEFKQALEQNDLEHASEEMGDFIFSLVNLCRHLKVDAEDALDRANTKFNRRFVYIEQALRQEGRSCQDATLAEMDRLWDEAKQSESSSD